MPTYVEVIIIGAGAAGLFCAIEAGKRGRSILVLDHATKAGKKILLSGGGYCNFTNRYASPSHYVSANPAFCISALKRFTAFDFEERVKRQGIRYSEKQAGQLFCSESAKDIVEMLLHQCRQVKAEICLNIKIICVKKHNDGFFVETNRGQFQCQSLVIASGGLSFPTMGASPFGYKIAEQFGLKITPVRAGLVPLTLHQPDLDKLSPLSGLSLPIEVRAGDQCFTEDLLLTHRGLSGPAILQISSYWQAGQKLHINLLPDKNALAYVQEKQLWRPKAELKTILSEVLPSRFAEVLCQNWLSNKPMNQYHTEGLVDVAKTLNDWTLIPNGTEGYRTAEVTLGGVDTAAFSSKTFEVKTIAGLYFIGEVLDVTGQLGGFNFQWAWASGFCAGQYV